MSLVASVHASFYKNKGRKDDLANERGIFNLCNVRSILDKLIYEDEYNTIDENLSCSNVGGRKGRSVRDHLFILYSIINEVKMVKLIALQYRVLTLRNVLTK